MGAENVNARPGGRSEARIAEVADIAIYRRRRACRLACRRAELHLRERGLWGPQPARVLADMLASIERQVT